MSIFAFKCKIFLLKIDWIGISQKYLFVTKHATYVFYSTVTSQFHLDKFKVFICNIKIFLKMAFFTVYTIDTKCQRPVPVEIYGRGKVKLLWKSDVTNSSLIC